jgi:hypothetical protein
MIRVVLLKRRKEKERGLIGMSPIPDDTYFVFQDVRPGTYFHSRGVLEPFDIAFLDRMGRPIESPRGGNPGLQAGEEAPPP